MVKEFLGTLIEHFPGAPLAVLYGPQIALFDLRKGESVRVKQSGNRDPIVTLDRKAMGCSSLLIRAQDCEGKPIHSHSVAVWTLEENPNF